MSEHKKSFVDSFPAASAVDLAALISYGDDAIVSRVIAKSPGGAGNLTLFAFARGQELSEHTAPFDALVQVLDGEAEVTVDGQAIRVPAGQCVLMPAGIPHAVAAPEAMKMLLFMFRA